MTQIRQSNPLYSHADASAVCFRRCREYIRQRREYTRQRREYTRQRREYTRQRRIYSRQRRKQITLALNRRYTMVKGGFVHVKRHRE